MTHASSEEKSNQEASAPGHKVRDTTDPTTPPNVQKSWRPRFRGTRLGRALLAWSHFTQKQGAAHVGTASALTCAGRALTGGDTRSDMLGSSTRSRSSHAPLRLAGQTPRQQTNFPRMHAPHVCLPTPFHSRPWQEFNVFFSPERFEQQAAGQVVDIPISTWQRAPLAPASL